MTFKKRTTETTTSEIKPTGHQCEAYGCPIAGSLSGMGGQNICGMHFGKRVSDYQNITKAIHSQLWIIECFFKITQSEKHYAGDQSISSDDLAVRDVIEMVKRKGREDLLPRKLKNRHDILIDENKNFGAWAYRLLATFNSSVGELPQESQPEMPKTPTAIAKMVDGMRA